RALAERRLEMGRRLIALKKRLKGERVWLAYIKMRGWSRATVDRLIVAANYPHKSKLLKLSTLGLSWSASQRLAAHNAQPQTLAAIEQRLQAGERLREHDIRRQVRPKHAEPLGIAARREEPTTEKQVLTHADILRDAANYHAKRLPDQLASFARSL